MLVKRWSAQVRAEGFEVTRLPAMSNLLALEMVISDLK